MSVISNRHSIVPFISGESKAMSGQRLGKIGYKEVLNKKTGKKEQKLPSVCVSVPVIEKEEIEGKLEALIPHIRGMLEGVQDKIVRSLYEGSEGALQSVSDGEISVAACIGFLEAESEGGRLTKEAVQNWFDGNLAENLSVYIAEKLDFVKPNEGQMLQIEQHVRGYREVLASLSGGATMLSTPQIKGCRKALELLEVGIEEDLMAQKLSKRLDAMEKPVMAKELLEL